MTNKKTNEQGQQEPWIKTHDATHVTCASCYGVTILEGKQEVHECPQCGCKDQKVRARYW